MNARPLEVKEIQQLAEVLRQVFKSLTDLRKTEPLAERIKYPQIPPALTESLAIHLLEQGKILPELAGFSFARSAVADVLATKAGEEDKKIEVKATGSKAFQYLSEKDVKAHYLIWLHFGNCFLNPKFDEIEVNIICPQNKPTLKSGKINLDQFKVIAGSGLQTVKIRLSDFP